MRFLELVPFVIRRLLWYMGMFWFKPLFKSHGKKFWFDPLGLYDFQNISVGDYVNLGRRSLIKSPKAKVTIGNKVMFGPDVVIISGDHNTQALGRFMIDVVENLPENDQDVTIEDDVWVGAKSIILKGFVIGRGAVVGAGSVVTKSVPPYAVVAGVPARVIKFRWDVDTILRHEELLYPPECRFSREMLDMQRLEC